MVCMPEGTTIDGHLCTGRLAANGNVLGCAMDDGAARTCSQKDTNREPLDTHRSSLLWRASLLLVDHQNCAPYSGGVRRALGQEYVDRLDVL